MNCLKCGRTVADGELLCPVCSGRGSHPEPEVKINVHTHHKSAPVVEDPEVVTTGLEKKIRRTRRWMVAFLVISLLFFGIIAVQFFHVSQVYHQLNSLEDERDSAVASQQESQEELELTRELLNSVEEDLTQKDRIIAAYEEMTGVAADTLP